MVEIEVEAAVHGETEDDGVYYFLDHQTFVVSQADAAVKHAGVPVVAVGAGSKPGEQAMEEQKFEVVAAEDGDKHVEEVLPVVHMVESKRLLPGTGCMAELEARVVALQQGDGTGDVAAVSASYSGSHSRSSHRAHSVLQAVVRVETPATEHYKARVVEHAAVGPLLQTTNLSNPADLVEVAVDLEAKAAAEAYNLESGEMDFCSLVWQIWMVT